jgi:hypothetical protein
MNDGHPTGEVRPVILRDVLNCYGTQGASLRSRLWAASRAAPGCRTLASCGEAMHVFWHVFYRYVLPNAEAPAAASWQPGKFPGYLRGEREMHKKLMASAVTGFLLLGAAGVAMAQEEGEGVQLVVAGVQTTSNVVVDPPIELGSPCVDAIQALRGTTPALSLRDTAVIQEAITFLFARGGGLRSALLVCAPEGTPVPAPA